VLIDNYIDEKIYHLGASLKDLGKKWFAFSLIEEDVFELKKRVTVVYNNKDTICDAIDSVLGQTHDDIEYIIIDGDSIDGTVDIINSYGDKRKQGQVFTFSQN